MKEIFQFLYQLEENNNKVWFDAHRSEYAKTKNMVIQLTTELIAEVQKFDPSIGYVNAKDCLFRIFRDLRFTQDKRPYKTNYGSFISRGGKCSGYPGYYVHFQPGHSFVAGGMYMPTPQQLKMIRTAIYEQTDEFLEIMNDPDFAKEFTLFDDGKLKLPPKGFPSDFEYIDWLKYKLYSPGAPVADEDLSGDYQEVFSFLVGKFKMLANFNHFLTEAIEADL